VASGSGERGDIVLAEVPVGKGKPLLPVSGRSAAGGRSVFADNSTMLRRPAEERELDALELVQPSKGAHPVEGSVPRDEQHGLHRGVLQGG
jgi:hypothetical protein